MHQLKLLGVFIHCSCIVLAIVAFAPTQAQQSSAPARSKIIDAENARPGTTDWILTKVIREKGETYQNGWNRRKAIEGYVSHTSIKAGETLKVYVSTDPADKYRLDIYRMGFYGGKGGRLMKTINDLRGTPQPTPGDGKRQRIGAAPLGPRAREARAKPTQCWRRITMSSPMTQRVSPRPVTQ